ncbi:MAG: metal ABC transporter ATP-binding protein [Candidatus Enterosoma sp.]|nr:metal ABC transporter ATP-binding protein [Bacilli bacterium]MDY5649663.1 metal ABC transporter ATP-binding protein [Candidatus Enterosoma sp.]
MIRFDNVCFSFPQGEVLKNVNFCLNDGQFIGILGPNGGGKSTFLKLALGLLKPTSGTVERKEEKIAYISQSTSLGDISFPATVEEIVYLGLVDNKVSFSYLKNRKRVEETLKELCIYDIRKRLISELSGGQLQKVKIAKALVSSPSLLVLDEPDIGMDILSHQHLLDVISSLHEKKKGILFVSHHPEDLKNADEIFFIEDGAMITYQEEKERGHIHVDL